MDSNDLRRRAARLDREVKGEARAAAKAMREAERGLPARGRWHDLGSDVNWMDHGGRWALRIGRITYLVVRFEQEDDGPYSGEAPAQYRASLSRVRTDNGQLAKALESSGLDPSDLPERKDAAALAKVEALTMYGAAAPLWEVSGTNGHRVLREVKSEARRLEADPGAMAEWLERPVNKIGSTAEEYESGDIASAVLRGLSEGKPEAEIMAKMGMLGAVKRCVKCRKPMADDGGEAAERCRACADDQSPEMAAESEAASKAAQP